VVSQAPAVAAAVQAVGALAAAVPAAAQVPAVALALVGVPAVAPVVGVRFPRAIHRPVRAALPPAPARARASCWLSA